MAGCAVPAIRVLCGSKNVRVRDLAGANGIISNYTNYYQLYFRWHDSTFTSNDSADLAILANKCPLIDGNVVYQARVLLRRLSQNIMVYNDNCLGGDHGGGGDQRLSNANAEDQQYSLMPNPNDGNMQLRQALSDLEPVRIKVYNVLGALVYSAVRGFEGNITTLDLSRETPGVYHISLQDSRGRSYSLRFVKK